MLTYDIIEEKKRKGKERKGRDCMTTEEYLIARKSKNWRFKKIVNEDAFLNVNRVHPLKQKLVRNEWS